jgi:regulator of replication initiation timing
VNELESLLEAERRAKQSAIEGSQPFLCQFFKKYSFICFAYYTENTRLEQDLLLARQSFEKQQNDQQIRSAKLAKLEEEKLRNFSLQLEEKNQTVQQLQRQLDVLNEDLSGFKSQTQQLSADCSALQLQNERLSDELMEFKSKSNVESGELAHNLQQIGQLQLELAAAQTEYSELQNRLRTIEEQSQNDLRTLEEQLQKQTADLDDIRLQLHDRDADLVTKVSEIEALNSTIIALQKSVDADVLRAGMLYILFFLSMIVITSFICLYVLNQTRKSTDSVPKRPSTRRKMPKADCLCCVSSI